MAELKLEHIYKVYPNGVKAVNDFTMNIKDKEFIVFVGPSGCGKSTTLRMIAGLEDITAGELYIGDQIVNDMEPKDRDIAMVFQNYALYPHMTVYENMAFGLRLRHMPNEEIHERVMWAADILGLKEYLDRKPKAMSGGQRQRVALGRAILRNPKVMLLDEPLSNLDAKLRSQMRSEISKLHQKLQTTFIYVTHDQVEAMTLGTRVVVMKLGVIQQIDTPKNLYDYPINKFVAGFIGTPQMNFFEGYLTRKGKEVEVKFDYTDSSLILPYEKFIKVKSNYLDGTKKVYIGLRCENISVEPDVIKGKKDLIDVRVSHFEELGNETLIYGDLNMQGEGFDETSTRVIIKASGRHGLQNGDIVKAYFDMNKSHYFDYETEESIQPRLPKDNLAAITIKDHKLTIYGETLTLPEAIKIDTFDGDVLIPSEAIIIGNEGIDATIKNIENVNGTKLVYLETNGYTYFTTSEEALSVNEKVKVNVDLSLVNIGNDIKAVREFDNFKANYYNFQTVYSNTSDSEFLKEKEKSEAIAKEKYENELKKTNEYYESEIAKAQNLNFDEIKNKNLALIKEEENKTKESLNSLKTSYKKQIKEIKDKHKTEVKKIKNDIKEIYAKRVSEENANYKEVLATNKDRDVILMRKNDHSVFKENLPKEKQNDLENKLNAEALVYDANRSSLTSRYKREKTELLKAFKSKKAELEKEFNLINVLKKEHADKLNELKKAYEQDLLKAGMVFFFKLQKTNEFYIPSIATIDNKLIQGLGSKVFSKVYSINIRHDAYKVSDHGLEVEVIDELNYGIRRYLVCKVLESGELIYFETNEKISNGTKIKLEIDLTKIQIIESSMNIRLY